MQKTAVIGASGFLGRELFRVCRSQFSDCIGTFCNHYRDGLSHLDFKSPDLKHLCLTQAGHKVAIISASIPQIDFCEKHKELAYQVNVRGTLGIISQLVDAGIKVVFLSSDYVFDGKTGEYVDDSPTAPGTEYGRQKELVEKELRRMTDRYLIIRLSKILSLSKNSGTLLDEIAQRLMAGERISAAYDQIFCPTLIDDVIRGITSMIAGEVEGVINFCNSEQWSRYNLAMAVAKALQREQLVQKVALCDIPNMDYRPKNTSMICRRLQHEIGLTFTPIQQCIKTIAQHWSVDT